ncbi:MAG: CHASE2 domain-containing protein [bacterium]
MPRVYKAILLGFLTGILGVMTALIPIGHRLEENVGLDFLFKRRKTRSIPSEAVIVTMDKSTCDLLNLPSEPNKWPRYLHARLTENLVKAGAALIVFDVMFNEPRSSEEDQILAQAISKAGNVVLCTRLKREIMSLDREDGTYRGDLNLVRLVPPASPLAESALALAPFPLPKVPVKLSQYWKFNKSAGDVPTLPVVAFQIYALDVYDEFILLLEMINPSHVKKLPKNREMILKGKNINNLINILRETFKNEPLLAKRISEVSENLRSVLDEKKIKLLKSLAKMYQGPDSHYLNYLGPAGTIPTISYHEVLNLYEKHGLKQKKFDFKGKVVFVGVSELMRPEQKDGFYTVFSQPNGIDITGVEIAATAFENLLEDNSIKPLCPCVNFASVFFWGFALGFVCTLFPLIHALASMIGLSLLYLINAQYQFNTACTWCPLIIPIFLQVPIAFFGAMSWKYFDAFKERQKIRKAFSYFLPDNVVDHIAREVVDLKKNSQIVFGTCLHTDAEHYTNLSESLPPNELRSFMNKYYETIFKPVKNHGGIVSDVIGDSMMAVWATTKNPDTLLRNQACLAALDITKMVKQFNTSFNGLKLPTRIGLHTGHMLLGTVGAMDHYEYRPLGDIVNTATRIEGLNKFLGTKILVSKEVLYQLEGFLTRELGEFLLLGKSKPVVIFELISRLEESDNDMKKGYEIFSEALQAYRNRSWEKAIRLFYQSFKILKEDNPSMFYIKLCKGYIKNPPKKEWAGLVSLNKK